MPEKPLLIFPEPSTVERHKKHGGPSDIHFPSPLRQRERLAPMFAQLEQAFRPGRAELRNDPAGIEPERVLVLETVGGIDEFYSALKGIEGLEWLGDSDVDDLASDEEFYRGEPGAGRTLSGRLYLILSNHRGLEELQSLWRTFQQNPQAPQFRRGLAKWRHLFEQLKDIRPWGPEDRIRETGLQDDWNSRVEEGQETLRVEVELWFRESATARDRAVRSVTEYVNASHGDVIVQSCIPEVSYHALLARLPIGAVEDLLNLRETTLVQCEQVMFVRPVGQAVVPVPEIDEETGRVAVPVRTDVPDGEPVIALLDGLPLENHTLLSGWLVVDDPDDWGADYPALERIHGTAMASLILHGELDAHEAPLERPIYVRPILKPNQYSPDRPRPEMVPEEVLPIDLVHRAVRRMFEGDGEQAAVAPRVRVINLSVGDTGRMFQRVLSPWARLLDYLAWRYKILIVVSAGNHYDFDLGVQRGDLDRLRTAPEELERDTIKALGAATRQRRLYSPAESLNAITVGAIQGDRSAGVPRGRLLDPFRQGVLLPAPYSAHGLGFNRSVKPDLMYFGGRQVYRERLGGDSPNEILRPARVISAPGQLVAAPGEAGDLRATMYMRGTSNAAALVTRTAGRLHSVIQQLRDEPNGNRLTDEYIGVVLKALLVHGASWGEIPDLLRTHLGDLSKDFISRFVGFGLLSPDRVVECEDERATLIGFGRLGDGAAHVYRLPPPRGLSGSTEWRRLTVTVAWFTPINPYHRDYRRAEIWFEPYGANKTAGAARDMIRVTRKQVDWNTARRGTVQHEIFEGTEASVFGEDEHLQIQVNCRADAGPLLEEIPYGLVVSLEVGSGVQIPVYSEVRDRIRTLVPVPVHPNAEQH